MTGRYTDAHHQTTRIHDPGPRIPGRLGAALNALRGRPTLYRVRITSGPTSTHIAGTTSGKALATQCEFIGGGTYIDTNGLTIARPTTTHPHGVIDTR